jgi:hypothetical protein
MFQNLKNNLLKSINLLSSDYYYNLLAYILYNINELFLKAPMNPIFLDILFSTKNIISKYLKLYLLSK